MRRRWASVCAALFLTACGGDDGGSNDDGGGGPPDGGGAVDGGGTPGDPCPPLPPPSGARIDVAPAQAGELPGIVAGAAPGTTIVLADGTYAVGATLRFAAAGVTLRSASNDAATVTLDGAYAVNELVFIEASDVTLAHVTLQRAVDHPVHVVPPAGGPDVTGTRLYAVRILDGGEQFVKVNPNGDRAAWVDEGRVECSLFRLTDDGRPQVERDPGGCYTGGIDAHSARGWIVRHNRFEDLYCAGEGLAEHAIHFWVGSRDTLVENNVILNCARGIGFGLGESGNGLGRAYPDDPYPGVGYVGHYDGLIRNNVIFADVPWCDTGIGLEQARGARVHHNTAVATGAATGFFSSIDYRFANTLAEIRNNLVRRITARDGAAGTVEANLEDVPLDTFVDAAQLDFHLAPGASAAIDRGVAVDDAGLDLDGEPHTNGPPDLGADER